MFSMRNGAGMGVMNAITNIAAHDRLDRASAAVANALRVLPAAGEPGYPSPGEIAAGLALIFRVRYGPMERLTLASAAMMALDADARHELTQAAERDRQAEEFPFPGVDPEMFRRVCREHRSPPLTPIEKRRADAIQFDDSPRAILAAAWAGASDRDRRDLVNRVTGRAAA